MSIVQQIRDGAERAEGGAAGGLWSAGSSAVALVLAGVLGIALREPWLFPSLGPTLMVLAETPRQPPAAPRNVLVGHLVGVAAGYGSLVLLRLSGHPPVIVEGLTVPRVLAAALSVAVTAFVLQALRTPHPPAGATTLIVSLGILSRPAQLGTLLLAVVLVTAVSLVLNRLMRVRHAGIDG